MPKIAFPELYEIPFFVVFLFIAATSVWRCFYLPVTPRDMLTGPELIAEFAVRERTMISSIYHIDLRMHPDSANNIFKSPFITGLQIIYKLLVHPFGAQWLSVVFLSFTLWFYTVIRACIHPFLACVLMLVYMSIPDLFAYTYLVLYDYSNMVFFFAGVYFLTQYLETRRMNTLLWSTFLLGIATYIRTETLIIVALGMPVLALYLFQEKTSLKTIALAVGLCIAMPLFFNFLYATVFIKHLVPIHYDLSRLINNPFNFSFFFEKLRDIAAKLMFASWTRNVYAFFFFIFSGILIIDIIWPGKFNKDACIALVSIAIVYVGLAVVAYLIKSTTIENTIKRGLFKLLPLMVWYLANSGILQKLSDLLKSGELALAAKGDLSLSLTGNHVAVSSPPRTEDEPDQSKVGRDVATVDEHIPPGSLFKETNDDKY